MTTLEETIRRALEAEASTVDVAPDALATIRARTRRRRTRGTVRVWLGGGLAVAAAATAAVFVFAAAPDPAPRPAGPTTGPTASPSPSPAAAGRLVAVYYVDDDRLVREFHRVDPASDTPADRVRAALALMFGTTPLDPDYRSAWPAGTTVRGVTVAGDVVTVDLGGVRPPSPVAAQQLVWTVTAASSLPGVRIGAGSPELRRAAAVDTLAPVWLINPQHGEVVRAGRLDVHVAGFGSTARLEIGPEAGGNPSRQDLTLEGGSPAQREAHVTVTLEPGRYTLTVTVNGRSDDHVVLVE